MNVDWKNIERIHFVGIKGVAMAALAVWAKEARYYVSGSDVAEEFPSDDILKKAKINVLEGFEASHIGKTKPDLVIFTGAHEGKENTEVREAVLRGIPVLPHGRALGEVMAGKRQISVAGSHGKTTTTAMIATILSHTSDIKPKTLPKNSKSEEIFISVSHQVTASPAEYVKTAIFQSA